MHEEAKPLSVLMISFTIFWLLIDLVTTELSLWHAQ